MAPLFHPGFYHKKWTCCDEASPEAEGCTATGSLSAAYEGNYHIVQDKISFVDVMKSFLLLYSMTFQKGEHPVVWKAPVTLKAIL